MKNFFVFIQAHPFHYHDYRAITAPGPRLTNIIENYPSKALGSPRPTRKNYFRRLVDIRWARGAGPQ